MTHSRLSTVVLILAIVVSTGHAYAQQDNSKNAALREKAFDLLESVASQLNSLQSAENRARLGANIMDSLWKHDEKRARALLALVEQDIKAGLDNSGDPQDQLTFVVFSKLRMDTVERIAKYDGETALAFLKSTKPTSIKPSQEGLIQNERDLELRLARQIAGSNPDVALNLGRQFLAKGFSDDLLLLFRKLSLKHRDQAQILYKEIVHKLAGVDFAADWNTRSFVYNLASSFRPPIVDDSTFGELVMLITTSALANGCGNKMSPEDSRVDLCFWLSSMIPRMEKYDPRAARLKPWMTANQEWEEQIQADYELNELLQEGNIDEILDLATKYPEHADEIYGAAIKRARGTGDFEKAREIANSRVTNPESRRIILEQIDQEEKRITLDNEKLALALKELNAIEPLQNRVRFLMSIVRQVGPTDQKAALKLLNQVSQIVDGMKPGKEQTQSQMALAVMYCLAKNDRGFDIMESLIPKLNELVQVAAKLDGYDTRYLRDGEWNMSANGVVGELLTGLAHNAASFAWCDFDRSLSLAAQFERLEIRLMAQVKLAQAILAGPPRRLVLEYGLMN